MALSIGELVGYVDFDTSKGDAALDKVGETLEKASGSWSKTLAKGGLAAGGAFATSLGMAMGDEVGSDKLAAQLGGTTKDAERFGDLAGRVYSNGFGAGLEDVNGAIAAVVTSIKGMRDASDADVQAMTEKAMTFADVMEVDVARASQVAGVMIHAGLAKNGGDAFDLLMRASQKVPAALREDVLDATEEYGQFFAQIGMTGPQAMQALVKGAEKGQFGIDKMGDAVKEFSLLVSTDMARTQPVIEALGLDYGDTANAMLAGGKRAGKATQSIIDGLLKVKDPAKQARMAVELFGTPIEDLNAKDLPAFLKSLQASGKGLGKWKGSVDEAGKVAYDNAATNLSMFGRGLRTHFVEMIGGKVLPKVTELTGSLATGLGPAFDKLGKIIAKASGFLSDHSKVVGVVAGVIASLLIPKLILMGIESMKAAGKSVAAWVSMQAAAIKTVAKHVWAAGVVVAKWAWMGVKALAHAAKVAAAWLVALGPVGVVIAVVAGLVALVVKYWDEIKAFTAKAWGAIVGALTKAWDKIKGAFTKSGAAVTSSTSKTWDKVKTTASKGIDKVVGFVKAIPGRFRTALSSLGSTLRGVFSNAMDSALEKVKGIGGRIRDWIAGIPGKLSSLGGKFAEAGRGLLQGFIDGMRNAAGIISGIAGNVWNAVRTLLNGAIDRINAALEFEINVMGKSFGVNPKNIPHLATGGRAYPDGRVVKIADGAEPETVLNDPQLRSLLTKAREAGRSDMADKRGGDTWNVYGAPGMDENLLAEKMWLKNRTRG